MKFSVLCAGALYFAAAVGGLLAQMRGLATTFDGSVLYYSNSQPLRGSGAPYQGRIFRWDAEQGVRLFAETVASVDQDPSSLPIVVGVPVFTTNMYDLYSPVTSADGSVVAWKGEAYCNCCQSCYLYPHASTEISFRGVRGKFVGNWGTFHLSANGRYGLITDGTVTEYWDLTNDTGSVIYGAEAPKVLPGGRRLVTDDGAAVISDSRSIVLWTPTRQQRLLAQGRTLAASRDGRTVIYSEWGSGVDIPDPIYSLDTATNRKTLLFSGPTDVTASSVSDDAKRLLLLVPEEGDPFVKRWLFLINSDGSGARWFNYSEQGYREGILSGDGRTIFVVSENNQLFRIDPETGASEELVERTPFLRRDSRPFARPTVGPDSILHLTGGGFAWQECVADSEPSPDSLCGVEVTYQGEPLKLKRVTPKQIDCVVPGNENKYRALTGTVRVTTSDRGIFEIPEW